MKFRYINTRNIYPYDRHMIDGLRENGHDVTEILENSSGPKKYLNLISKIRKDKSKYDATFIGFPSPLYAIIASLFVREKIIFNAVSSQYEANIVSRMTSPYSLSALKWWIIDFLSFHLSDFVLLETAAQIKYVNRLVRIPKRKLILSFTGVNEKDFFYDPSIKKEQTFTVLFRGRFLPESGIDTVIRAAKILEEENIRFRIIGVGHLHKEFNALIDELKPANLERIHETLEINVLRQKMQSSHISLGQMADHKRLERTVPCKLFETLAQRLPYLTGRNLPVFEILKENVSCFCSNPGDPKDLAEKILYLRNNPSELNTVAERGYKVYLEKLTSKKLARSIINSCFN